MESRAARALFLTRSGELSSARQALEGAEVAPGNLAALGALTDHDANFGDGPCTVEYTFIQTRFHPMTLSSKTLSSNNNFIQ